MLIRKSPLKPKYKTMENNITTVETSPLEIATERGLKGHVRIWKIPVKRKAAKKEPRIMYAPIVSLSTV